MTNVPQSGGHDDRRVLPPVEPVPDDPLPWVPPVPDPPRRRGWWAAAAVVVALIGCLGAASLSLIGDDRAPAPADLVPDPPLAGPTLAKTVPAVLEVVYLVSSDGKGDVARVEYTDEDTDIIRKGEVSLPWRLTFRVVGDKPPLVLLAQRTEGGTSPVTCSISVNGKVLTTEVQRGRSAAPQCSA